MSCSLQDGKIALHLAAEKGHTDVVDILLKKGLHMDINEKDKVRLVIDTCAYLYLFFKGVIMIFLSSATILDDVHV